MRSKYLRELWCGQATRNGDAVVHQVPAGWQDSSFDQGFRFCTVGTLAQWDHSDAWTLALVTDGASFSEGSISQARLAVQTWQCQFLNPSEFGICQVLLGANLNAISTDFGMRKRLQASRHWLDRLKSTVFPIFRQRFSDVADDVSYDLCTVVDGEPLWIAVRRTRVLRSVESTRWHLTLRPCDTPELCRAGLLEDERIARSVGRLDLGFSSVFKLETSARLEGMSTFHFQRVFSRAVGVSPKQYQLLKQMMVARWLLRTCFAPISTVAEMTGFQSHGHFSATFSRLVGATPTRYRHRTMAAQERLNHD
ncbi:MAG: AraC family transcriptional regulator [Planctomycetota bacterium]